MNFEFSVPKFFKRWQMAFVGVFALLLAVSGCSKQGEVDTKKPFALTGAPKVIQALEKKDYEATVAALAEVKATITEKDIPEYRRLRERVLDQLVAEMGESEPAKEAYRAIGMMEHGR